MKKIDELKEDLRLAENDLHYADIEKKHCQYRLRLTQAIEKIQKVNYNRISIYKLKEFLDDLEFSIDKHLKED